MILRVNSGAFHQPTIPSSKRRISRHFYSSQNKRKKCERVVSRRVRLRKVHLFAANESEERERELDEKTREALRLPSKSSQDDEEAPSQKGNERFGNVDGGKYGLGNRVDKALDATTDELQFKIGAIVCVTLPVLLLIFGPRPPSEY